MVADAVSGAPDVEHLHTRSLERRALARGYPASAEVVEQGLHHVTLRTDDRSSTRLTDWEGREPFTVDPSVGKLRIDVVAADVLRVRYAPGPLPAATSPMLVGSLEPGAAPTIEVGDGSLTITTEALRATLDAGPIALRVLDAGGREACRIGGREKNWWALWDAHATGVSRTVDGHPLATECFALRPGEAVFGFGEQFGRLNKAGQTIDLNMVEATGTTTPRSYKNVPFFWSSHGYGVFLHTSARATAWVGSRNAADVCVAVEDDHLDYFVFVGDPRRVIDRYWSLTGRPALPPRWSFGWWQSKISYASADEALDIVRRYRAADLPVDVVHLDTHWFREDWRCDLEFDPDRFPDPRAFLAEMAELGVHVSLWQLPYIPEGSALFDELEAVDGFVQHPDGGTYDVAICYTPGWSGRVGCIDMTNPAAVAVYQRHLRRLHELGAAAIKADFGEQAPLDGVYHDGTPGHRMHNLYPLLYNRAVAEATHEATGDWIIWARSAWAGSHRYPLHWGGDSSANWDNLGPQFAAGLSMGLSGFSYWSQDIGGFLSIEPVGGDLLVRWVQAGVLVSHARIHGAGPRELDRLDPATLAAVRPALELRYRLLPYLLGEAARGRPGGLARALVVEFPDDPSTWNIDDQWLLGEHLLVAPVFDPSGRRRAYLPAGRWADWWTGAVVEGPAWIEVEAPIEEVPLWIRGGGAVALGPAMGHVGERPTDEVTVRAVAPSRPGDAGQGVFDVDGELIDWSWDGGRFVHGTTTATVHVDLLGEERRPR